MRNRYPGTCYRCGGVVPAGAGHFERQFGAWKVQHAECAVKYRGTDVGVDLEAKARQKEWLAKRQINIWIEKARGSGPRATKARRALRERGISWEPGT